MKPSFRFPSARPGRARLENTDRMDANPQGVTAASPASTPAAPTPTSAPSALGEASGAAPRSPSDVSADPGVTGGQDQRVPYDRLKAVVDQKNELAQQLEAIQAQAAERERQWMERIAAIESRDPMADLKARLFPEPEPEPEYVDPVESKVDMLERQLQEFQYAAQLEKLTTFYGGISRQIRSEFQDVPAELVTGFIDLALRRDPTPATALERARAAVKAIVPVLQGYAKSIQSAPPPPPDGGHLTSTGALTFDSKPRSIREASQRVAALAARGLIS